MKDKIKLNFDQINFLEDLSRLFSKLSDDQIKQKVALLDTHRECGCFAAWIAHWYLSREEEKGHYSYGKAFFRALLMPKAHEIEREMYRLIRLHGEKKTTTIYGVEPWGIHPERVLEKLLESVELKQ